MGLTISSMTQNYKNECFKLVFQIGWNSFRLLVQQMVCVCVNQASQESGWKERVCCLAGDDTMYVIGMELANDVSRLAHSSVLCVALVHHGNWQSLYGYDDESVASALNPCAAFGSQ